MRDDANELASTAVGRGKHSFSTARVRRLWLFGAARQRSPRRTPSGNRHQLRTLSKPL